MPVLSLKKKEEHCLFLLEFLKALIRLPAGHRKIEEHHEKLDTENTDEIHKREPDLSDLKPVRKRNRPKERNEHPDQDKQKDLNHVSMLTHMTPCNENPLKTISFFP
jgi:hypothetical protein